MLRISSLWPCIGALALLPVGCDDDDGGGTGGAGAVAGAGGTTSGTGTNTGTSTGTNTGGTGSGVGGSAVGGAGGMSGGTGGAAGGAGGSGGGGGSGVSFGPSCDSLPANCGPNADENCCTSPVVPGGTFYRSYDGIDHTDNSYPATVSAFALDRFEVTVGRFRAFVNAGKGTQASPPNAGDGAHPLITDSGWNASWSSLLEGTTPALKTALECSAQEQTWTEPAGANETLPINCVTWYEAFAFCAWDGGRLPTEAEWNYAAAGGSEQRYYAWSDSYPPGSTTLDPTYALYDCLGDGNPACAFADIFPVGSRSPKGDGRWGQADLSGSMWEHGLDWSSSDYTNPCIDCANLTVATGRVLRGGDWSGYDGDLLAAARNGNTDTNRGYDDGLRCARTP